jgi:hypothetical protein
LNKHSRIERSVRHDGLDVFYESDGGGSSGLFIVFDEKLFDCPERVTIGSVSWRA